MIQILRKAQKQQGDGQTSLDEKERTPLTKEQKEARLKDETQKKQDLRLKQEQEEQQKKKAQEEEEQKKKRKQTSLRKKEEETHLKDEDTKQKKDKKKAEDVALKRARLETAKRETEEKKAVTADKKQKAAASKEKQERAQIVVQGLRSLSQTGIHNMSAVDREQFFALAMEYKALASTGAIQFEQQEEVESMLQQLTGLASDKSEVNFYLTKAQEERAEKERKNAEKMADFLKSFKKNPYIIYEDVDSFVQAVEEGHISADTIVTNANGEEVTLREFNREMATEIYRQSLSLATDMNRTQQAYQEHVVVMSIALLDVPESERNEHLRHLNRTHPEVYADVLKTYESIVSAPEKLQAARQAANQFSLNYNISFSNVQEVTTEQEEQRIEKKRITKKAKAVRDVAFTLGDERTAYLLGECVLNEEQEEPSQEQRQPENPAEPAVAPSVPHNEKRSSVFFIETPVVTSEQCNEQIDVSDFEDTPKTSKSKLPKDLVDKFYVCARDMDTGVSSLATLSNAANNGPSVVGGFGDKVPMNDYADDFGYNQGGNGHRSC